MLPSETFFFGGAAASISSPRSLSNSLVDCPFSLSVLLLFREVPSAPVRGLPGEGRGFYRSAHFRVNRFGLTLCSFRRPRVGCPLSSREAASTTAVSLINIFSVDPYCCPLTRSTLFRRIRLGGGAASISLPRSGSTTFVDPFLPSPCSTPRPWGTGPLGAQMQSLTLRFGDVKP